MATKKKISGYAFNQEIVRMKNAHRTIRQLTNRIITENLGEQTRAVLLARVANASAEATDALTGIEMIARDA